MSEQHYAEQMRVLCSEYFNRNLSPVEYRARRRQLIAQMDVEHNGAAATSDADITQPQIGREH